MVRTLHGHLLYQSPRVDVINGVIELSALLQKNNIWFIFEPRQPETKKNARGWHAINSQSLYDDKKVPQMINCTEIDPFFTPQ
jgi:hypothetical protein